MAWVQISSQQSEVDIESCVDALKHLGASDVQGENVASEISSGDGFSIHAKNSARAKKLSICWELWESDQRLRMKQEICNPGDLTMMTSITSSGPLGEYALFQCVLCDSVVSISAFYQVSESSGGGFL